MMRLRMSRPNSSVPIRCASDAGSSRSPTPILFGSAGANTPGATAHIKATTRTIQLTLTSSFERSGSILGADARVDECVGDVHDQVGQGERHGDVQDSGLNDRVIAVED